MTRRLWMAALVTVLALGLAGSVWAMAQTYRGYNVVQVTIDGKPLEGDVPAIEMDGRTLVPLRAVAEALALEVTWDEETNTVAIRSQPQPVIRLTVDKEVLLPGEHGQAFAEVIGAGGQPIPGAEVVFTIAGPSGLINPETGQFLASEPGVYTIAATFGDLSESVEVRVRDQ